MHREIEVSNAILKPSFSYSSTTSKEAESSALLYSIV